MIETVSPNYLSGKVNEQKLKRQNEKLKPKTDEFARTIVVKPEIWKKIEEYSKKVNLSSSISIYIFSFYIYFKSIKI